MALRSMILLLSDRLDRGIRWVTMTFLVLLVGLVVLQVVARYLFASPPAWTEEMARYAMIWSGLLGATMSFKRRFDPALFDGLAPSSRGLALIMRIARALPVLVWLVPILVFCFVGANLSVERSFLVRQTRMTMDAFDAPMILVGIAVPIMIVTILIHLMARWCVSPDDPPGEAGGLDVG